MKKKVKSKKLVEIKQEKEKLLLLENLKECPIIQVSVKKSGISRATYYRWRKEDSNFCVACDTALSEGIEYINDMSESQLISLIKDKKLPAIAMWLRHNHPKYKSRLEVEYTEIPEETLSPKQKKIITKALRMTMPIKSI